MSWIKNLFGKKEEVVVQPKEEIQQIPSPVPKEAWICDYCKGSIDVGERWSKFQGKYFHKACFKLIKRGAFAGQ